MTAIACVLFFIGAMLMFFTDNVGVAAVLITAGSVLVCLSVLRSSKEGGDR